MAICLSVALAAAACGDSYVAPVLSGIAVESGNLQTAKVCTALPEALVVFATNQFGDAQPGTRVEFTATAGSFQPAVVLADAQGRARSVYTLGSEPGPVTVTASSWQGEMTARFDLVAEADPPRRLQRVSGNNQSGLAGQPLASQLVSRVLDACNVPVPGVTVSWQSSGGGQLAAATLVTDGEGYARNTFTLPEEPGSLTVTATVEGLQAIIFTVTASTE